ncbi:MAG: hypothetical protein IPL65_15670 [Lewinellaceae bacterium]|nr:hypothetical protein [Lewinellaceae bacterium]
MNDIALWRKSWQDEVDANFLYQVLVDCAISDKEKSLYRELGQCEAEHIDAWENLMQEHQENPGRRKPSTKAKILAWIGRHYNTGFLQQYMGQWEGREVREYLLLHLKASRPETRAPAANWLTRRARIHANR